MHHRRARVKLLLAILIALDSTPVQGAGSPKVRVEVTRAFRGQVSNYDDPCFWQDPQDASRAIACITSKDGHRVECFDLKTNRRLERAATGFSGEANNCDIDSRSAEMATTDNDLHLVRIHSRPSLGLVRSLPVPGSRDLSGICFGTHEARRLLFVTDERTGLVTVLDAKSGAIVREWPYLLKEVESIACDDEWSRVIVCDDQGRDPCRTFGYTGEPGPKLGKEVLGPDAEGVAIYRCPERQGYVVVSDQSNDEFEVFERDGFRHVCTFSLARGSDRTDDTDGIDILQSAAYPEGLFGACDGCDPSPGDELHLVPWPAIARACGLRICPLPSAED